MTWSEDVFDNESAKKRFQQVVRRAQGFQDVDAKLQRAGDTELVSTARFWPVLPRFWHIITERGMKKLIS